MALTPIRLTTDTKVMIRENLPTLLLQLLLFVLFFKFFGLPLIHKFEEEQVRFSFHIALDLSSDLSVSQGLE